MLSVALLNEMAAIAAELYPPEAYERELFRVLEPVVGADVLFFKRRPDREALAALNRALRAAHSRRRAGAV